MPKKRDHYLNVRLTAAEHTRIRLLARDRDMSVAELIRNIPFVHDVSNALMAEVLHLSLLAQIGAEADDPLGARQLVNAAAAQLALWAQKDGREITFVANEGQNDAGAVAKVGGRVIHAHEALKQAGREHAERVLDLADADIAATEQMRDELRRSLEED